MADSAYLYRIMSFRHVVDMFEARTLHLSSPTSWDDPYEKLVEHARQDSVFAQCWSMRETSDAMWRIYSPDRMSLSIRTSRSRLVQALETASQTVPIQYSVMNVEYLSESEVIQRVSTLAHEAQAANASVRGAMAALFVKRAPFDHEVEVRAVVHLLGESPYGGPGQVLRIPIDPHLLVDRIVFDPRVDPIFMRVCAHYLKTSVKYARELSRSRLYDGSEYTVVV